jgi:hypothetical protein
MIELQDSYTSGKADEEIICLLGVLTSKNSMRIKVDIGGTGAVEDPRLFAVSRDFRGGAS